MGGLRLSKVVVGSMILAGLVLAGFMVFAVVTDAPADYHPGRGPGFPNTGFMFLVTIGIVALGTLLDGILTRRRARRGGTTPAPGRPEPPSRSGWPPPP